MAMQTVYLKEREGIAGSNLPSVPQTPWWTAFGSQAVFRESGGQSGTSAVESLGVDSGDLLTGTKQGFDKGSAATHFTLSTGDGKNSSDKQKAQGAFPVQSACFELGFGQSMICGKHPYMDQYCGVLSTYGPQISGRIMLPLSMATEDGPIYVNAKQYHGIIRRRQSRAKVVLENKMARNRKQPYMHLSRHLHAMRRPRGSGGRFLNTKNPNTEKDVTKAKKASEGKQPQPTGSQNSEVLHPENGTLNSSKEATGNGSNISGSEVTSMYSRGGDVDRFLGSSIHSLSGIVMPSAWVAMADDSRCNLKV